MAVAMDDTVLQRYPLLRLLLFYLCGVGLADVLYVYIGMLGWYSLCGMVILLFSLLFAWVLRCRIAYGMVSSALFLMLGICNYSQARGDIEYEWEAESLLYEARVMAEPRVRQRSVLCEVEVTAVCDSSEWHRVGRKVMIYMEPDGEANALLPGDMLCFRGRVRSPRNFSDSLAFDYARYVTMQGASGVVYVPCQGWSRVGEGNVSLLERMLRFRQELLGQYMIKSFGGDAFGVLSALTLGDKRGLSTEVRELYSNAGAAHVLALSGLHVGIIYGILTFLLRGLIRKRKFRWLPEVLTVGVLWAFAFMVGMSASVLRAVAMCTLYVIARWLSDGTTSSIHVLSLSAFVMSLVRPFYLFDVGFQLSFMAMASILWFEPHLEGLFQKRAFHPVLAYLVGIVCMSLAAQLGTFPLVLHHFGTFPTYFLVTNLVVVPLLFVVMLLMMVWWALALLDISLARPLGTMLQWLVEHLNGILQNIGQWPGAVLHAEGYNALAVLFTYLFILFAGLFLVKKWSRGAVFATASLLGLLVALL